jgi:hypothetical protein
MTHDYSAVVLFSMGCRLLGNHSVCLTIEPLSIDWELNLHKKCGRKLETALPDGKN